MLKKQGSSSIVRLMKWAVLALFMSVLAGILGRALLNSGHAFKDLNLFFSQFKWLFLIWHGLFYAVLYLAWPKLVLFVSHRQQVKPNPIQINRAIQARIYLVGVLLVFELLNLLR